MKTNSVPLPSDSITVSILPRPEQSGDWHDKPLRYSVDGPRDECQKFSTKKDALKYRALRRKSPEQHTAIKQYVAS